MRIINMADFFTKETVKEIPCKIRELRDFSAGKIIRNIRICGVQDVLVLKWQVIYPGVDPDDKK